MRVNVPWILLVGKRVVGSLEPRSFLEGLGVIKIGKYSLAQENTDVASEPILP